MVNRDTVTEWEVTAALGGGFIVLRNGYQWGTDREKFDHMLGCSSQVFESVYAAQEAIDAGIDAARKSNAR